MDQDTRILLRRAVNELRELRRRLELAQAKTYVVDVFAAALLGPPQRQGETPDLVWEIEKALREHTPGAAS